MHGALEFTRGRLSASLALAAIVGVTGCAYGGAAGARPESSTPADSLEARAPGEIGDGRVHRGTVTGAVTSLDMPDASRRPQVRSLADLLQGRVAGLEISNTAGGGVAMRIRNAGGPLSGGDPLVVVDGDPFPAGPMLAGMLSQINPADVIRVDVLKDASSTAVYGSRGRNGVVLITLRHSH